MNIYHNCIFCNGELKSLGCSANPYLKEKPTRYTELFLCKFCKFNVEFTVNSVDRNLLTLYLYSSVYRTDFFLFDFLEKDLKIVDYLFESKQLPWFDPDLSNYDRLLSKLKLYMTFI